MWRSLVVVVAALPACGRHEFGRADAAGAPDAAAAACVAVTASAECPIPVAYTCDGRCYLNCDAAVTRPAAAVVCQAWGGALATVLDDDANNCAASRIRGSEIWIGAEQRGATTPSADWYWPAGEPMGFTRWVQGDPDDEDGVEDGESNCLILDLGAGWWDRPCGNQYGFVCDRP